MDMRWRIRRLLIITTVIAAVTGEAVVVATASANLSPRGDKFLAVSDAVGFESGGGEVYAWCELTAKGTVPPLGSTMSSNAPAFEACKVSGIGKASVTTSGTWQFATKYGPPTTVALKIPAKGLVLTFGTTTQGDCKVTFSTAYSGPADTWVNGSDEGISVVESESTLNDSEIVAEWANWEGGTHGGKCFIFGSPRITLFTSVAPAYHPLIWKDESQPLSKTILVTP